MRRLTASVAGVLVLAGCNLLKGPPRDHECRSALRSITAAEFSFYSEHQRYSVHPAEIGWAPSLGNRYLYLFAPEGDLTRRDEVKSPPLMESVGYGPDSRTRAVLLEDLLLALPADVRAMTGLKGACPACELTVACVANLDADADVDVWTVSTADRPGAARGTPLHHLRDL